MTGVSRPAACRPPKPRPASTNSLELVTPGQLTIGTDNPAFPPWFEGTKEFEPWDPTTTPTKKGYEAEVAYAIARELGFSDDQVEWTVVPFNQSFRPGPKQFDFDINQISYLPERANAVDFSDSYYDVEQAVVAVEGTPAASATSIEDLKQYKLGAQIGTTSLEAINQQIEPAEEPFVYDTNNDALSGLKANQVDALVLDFPTALFMAAVQLDNGKVVGRLPAPEGGEYFGVVLEKDSALTACVNEAIATLRFRRDDRRARAEVARRQRAGSRVAGDRSSRILGGGGAARSTLIAAVSTIAFFGLLVLLVVNAPGWPEVRDSFLNGEIFWESLREIAPKLLVNIEMFLIAEVFILVFGLAIAILRSLPGPVFFPVRLLSVVYTDFFRGVPTILDHLHPGLRRPCARALRRTELALLLGCCLAGARLLGLRERGLPRRDRVDPPEPGGCGSLLGVDPPSGIAIRDRAAGRSPRDSAAAQRLHRSPEGHCARRPDWPC